MQTFKKSLHVRGIIESIRYNNGVEFLSKIEILARLYMKFPMWNTLFARWPPGLLKRLCRLHRGH